MLWQWLGVLGLLGGPGLGTAPGAAADAVTLRDGRVVLGQVVESAPRGKVIVLVRREWAKGQLPEWAKRWETAEAAGARRARRDRHQRLLAWRRERGPTPGRRDAIGAW